MAVFFSIGFQSAFILGFTGFSCSFPELYGSCTGFTQVHLVSTRFHRVLTGLTGFDWV